MRFQFFSVGSPMSLALRVSITRCQRRMPHLGQPQTSPIYVGLLTKAKQRRAEWRDLCAPKSINVLFLCVHLASPPLCSPQFEWMLLGWPERPLLTVLKLHKIRIFPTNKHANTLKERWFCPTESCRSRQIF